VWITRANANQATNTIIKPNLANMSHVGIVKNLIVTDFALMEFLKMVPTLMNVNASGGLLLIQTLYSVT
jgi:hypothetical protein